MFSKIYKTAFAPIEKPMMVWDGECGFCKYWITHWNSKTDDRLDYFTFQEVASQYPDIPLQEFRKASRLIETDGRIYSGPDSAFRSFSYFNPKTLVWHRWYNSYKWFTFICDHGYNFIATHRPFMFNLTILFFGKDPKSVKPYWAIIILLLIAGYYTVAVYL
jgi:predicted DCC family thiol-disulfide oxidoreductase YuxK